MSTIKHTPFEVVTCLYPGSNKKDLYLMNKEKELVLKFIGDIHQEQAEEICEVINEHVKAGH